MHIGEPKSEEGKEGEVQANPNQWQSPPHTERVLEEVEIEDKVMAINTIGDTYNIWVLHQAAQRMLRKDIVQQMKKNVKELENIDLDEMLHQVEQHANEVENKFIEMTTKELNDEGHNTPVFDFELN